MANTNMDDVVKSLNILTEELGRFINQQQRNIPNSSLDYRNNNLRAYRFGQSSLEKNSYLRENLNIAERDVRTATSFRRFLPNIEKEGRELKYQEQRLRQSIDENQKTINELKNLIGKKNISDVDAIKKAQEEIDKLKEKLDLLKDSFEETFDNLTDGVDVEKTREALQKLNEEYENILNGNKKPGELAKELNKLVGGKKFSAKNIKDLANKLDELAKTENKLEDYATKTNDVYEKRTEQLNEQIRLSNLAVETAKSGFDKISHGFSKLKSLANDLTNSWRKVDHASANFAKNVGVGSRGLVALRNNTIKMVKNGIAINYGIGMEELVELQQNYVQATGRNIGLTNNDIETSAAMSRLMGGKGAEFASALENFGLSYSETGERVGKMFKTASKYGLSFEKYSQNFLTNIKLAQNYTFKDGLKGLERMAQKSTAIKIDMQQIASFAEKVRTLQGAVESSAALQVLGGPFAQFADPLGMLNEGLNDMEGLMERFQKMTGNLGKFNSQKGEVEVTAFNKERIRAAAQAMGMDYGQVMESIQSQGRRKFIEDNINGNFTDEEKEFLKNSATIQDGKAFMTYINNEGKRVEKDINTMNSSDIKQARAQALSDSDNIKDIAKATRSFNEKVEGIEKHIEAVKAGWVNGSMNWISEKMNSITNYLGLGFVGAIVIGKGISAIGSMVKGTGNIAQGLRYLRGTGTRFNEGVALRNAGYSGLAGRGSFGSRLGASKFGQLAAKAGGKYGAAAGAGGIITGSLAAIAAAVYGIKKITEARKEIEERNELITRGLIKKGDETDRKKTLESYQKQGRGIGIASGALAGAAIGSFIPIIGTLIGAAVGAGIGLAGGHLGGTIFGKHENERRRKEVIVENRFRNSLKRSGFDFKGGYSEEEYKKIVKAINNGSDNTITKAEFEDLPEELRNKLIKSGDVSLFHELEEFKINEATMEAQTVNLTAKDIKINKDGSVVTKANGGLLNGPSHRNGGMPILGSNIEVEGGEFVVNKHAAKNNLGLLTSINKMGSGGIISPREDSGIRPVKVIPLIEKISNIVNKTQHEPINVNISGTIKLDGGNGKEIDMNALLKDPVFIRNITHLIEQQMIYTTKGARYTDTLVK